MRQGTSNTRLCLGLYETGMRVGEASQLRFKDFDFDMRAVRVLLEKDGRVRELRLSEKACSMFRDVYSKCPKNPLPDPRTARRYLERTRAFLARTNSNPRFLNIHLHMLRHYKATILYHQTRDLLYVQETLGHKSISNTLRHTQLIDWKDSEQFVCKQQRPSQSLQHS